MSSLMFIDVETTGLDKHKHAIVEIALTPVIGGETKETLCLKMKPFDGAIIDQEALKIHGYSFNEIMSWEDPGVQLKKAIEFIDSFGTVFRLAGHNIKFDNGFLFMLFSRHGEYSSYITRFRADSVCTYEMAKTLGKKHLGTESLKLGDLCKKFGIELNKVHSAKDDIEATVKLYHALDAMMPRKVELRDDMSYHDKRRKYLDRSYIMLNPEGDVFLTKAATQNKEVLMFILSELWGLYGD